MTTADETARRLRWQVYLLLFAVSAGMLVGRILAVSSVDVIGIERRMWTEGQADWRRQRPFLSANDRSRWATVRALVEHGTYAIDDVVRERGWDTIDMVQHLGPDGQPHLYSSKPPLFATLLAGPYWLIHRASGATLGEHPYEIGRLLLVLANVVPLMLYFGVLALLAERLGRGDWPRVFVAAAAAFGTFLTTFAVSINNHLPAAVCAAVALWAVVRIWYDGERRKRYFVAAAFAAAFAAANELPALSLLALVGAALAWKAPRETLVAFMPATLLVAAAFFGTNYAAHATLRPPYMHRSATNPADNWYDYSYERNGRQVDSYWRQPVGVDRGEPSAARYALHATIGHHGILSLTPIWLLSAWGLALMAWRPERRALAALIGGLSVVCLAFYLSRPELDRNYGGTTSGFRWMFWFAPLWLVSMLPALERLDCCRGGRGFALALLALSVLSASYPTWNPWTNPWLWNFFTYLGWA